MSGHGPFEGFEFIPGEKATLGRIESIFHGDLFHSGGLITREDGQIVHPETPKLF